MEEETESRYDWSMTREDLDALEQLASAGPWYVRTLDGEMCMGACAASTRPDTGMNENMRLARLELKDRSS